MVRSFTPTVGSEIFALRPDYTALSLLVDFSTPPVQSGATPVARIPDDPAALPVPVRAHLEAWRDAYRAFGANPRRYRCSAEALIERFEAQGSLPDIHPIVNAYNAISVRFGLPIGGEDATAYHGVPRLVRAAGNEPFDTIQAGNPITEGVTAGEVIWRDDSGVTCRRWNWRQCVRTRVTPATRRAWFVLECLEPFPIAALLQAGRQLLAAIGAGAGTELLHAALIDRTGPRSVGQDLA